jgi:hypothetical protein
MDQFRVAAGIGGSIADCYQQPEGREAGCSCRIMLNGQYAAWSTAYGKAPKEEKNAAFLRQLE